MAYEFEPEYTIGDPVSDGAKGEVIEFALGYDPDLNLIAVMAVMLLATSHRETMEFAFGIRTRFGDGPASEPDYGKEATDRYIPKEGRTRVKDTIQRCISKLVSSSMPERIIMETFYPNLEPKALRKYEAICGAIIACGYLTADEFRDPETGINYWHFEAKGGDES